MNLAKNYLLDLAQKSGVKITKATTQGLLKQAQTATPSPTLGQKLTLKDGVLTKAPQVSPSYPTTVPQAGINLKRFDVSEPALQKGEQLIADMKPLVEKTVGKTLSHKEVKDFADTSNKLLTRAVGRLETLRWESALKNTSDRLAA